MITTLRSMMYAFHIILHPFDGFWDLKHHKKNTLSAANIILILVCTVSVLRLELTHFLFNWVKPEDANVLMQVVSMLAPIAVWTVINWSLSTLMDGKATMKQIWVQTIFSLFPLILLQVPAIILSHVFTIEEQMFFTTLNSVATYWSLGLILIGNMTIQDYTMGKTIAMAVFTMFGIVAVIFIGVVLFSTLQQLVTFITTVYLELKFR